VHLIRIKWKKVICNLKTMMTQAFEHCLESQLIEVLILRQTASPPARHNSTVHPSRRMFSERNSAEMAAIHPDAVVAGRESAFSTGSHVQLRIDSVLDDPVRSMGVFSNEGSGNWERNPFFIFIRFLI
jgi:hypothetical protein